MDSSRQHAFTFQPAVQIVVECESEREVDELYLKLSDDGTVLMPLQAYPFSVRFAWLEDGVSCSCALGAGNRRDDRGRRT